MSQQSAAEPSHVSRLELILSEAGYQSSEMEELLLEVEALEHPPGMLTRMTSAAREKAKTQWGLLMGEFQESREAMALLTQRLLGKRDLSAEERDKVRAQFVDALKVVPASVIAAANSAFPVPGTGLLTPWLLTKLGLLPSRWREAHLLEELRKRQQELQGKGDQLHAQQIGVICDEIIREAELREEVQSCAGLLTHWDENENGRWDDNERKAYLAELARLQAIVGSRAQRKEWFLEKEGTVFGAIRLTSVMREPDAAHLLVCHQGKTGWVLLGDLLLPS